MSASQNESEVSPDSRRQVAKEFIQALIVKDKHIYALSKQLHPQHHKLLDAAVKKHFLAYNPGTPAKIFSDSPKYLERAYNTALADPRVHTIAIMLRFSHPKPFSTESLTTFYGPYAIFLTSVFNEAIEMELLRHSLQSVDAHYFELGMMEKYALENASLSRDLIYPKSAILSASDYIEDVLLTDKSLDKLLAKDMLNVLAAKIRKVIPDELLSPILSHLNICNVIAKRGYHDIARGTIYLKESAFTRKSFLKYLDKTIINAINMDDAELGMRIAINASLLEKKVREFPETVTEHELVHASKHFSYRKYLRDMLHSSEYLGKPKDLFHNQIDMWGNPSINLPPLSSRSKIKNIQKRCMFREEGYSLHLDSAKSPENKIFNSYVREIAEGAQRDAWKYIEDALLNAQNEQAYKKILIDFVDLESAFYDYKQMRF